MARCEICGVLADNLAVVEIDSSCERLLLCREMGQERAPMTIYSMETFLGFVGKL